MIEVLTRNPQGRCKNLRDLTFLCIIRVWGEFSTEEACDILLGHRYQ
jgi:hypothetical protein